MRQYPITDYILAADLGRDRDHSAFAILAVRQEDYGRYDFAAFRQPTRVVLQLGALRRIPLGTQYLEVVGQIRQTVTRLHAIGGWGARPVRVHVIVDAAGPGQVAIELIRAQQLDINFTPALLTAGYETGYSPSGKLTIPRREVITNLRYLLEIGLVRVQKNLTHKAALESEIAQVRFGGRQSAHDDLVIATGLAAFPARRIYPELVRPTRAA
jgi:hypothetical protein